MKIKKLVALMAVVAMLLSLAACSGGGQDAATEGGEIIFTVAIAGGYDTLNFFSTESSMVYDFLNFCYDSLIAYDSEFNAIPRLAESWEVSDDGTVWTFHLRDDAYFTDGEQVTSADVQWTYENAIDSYMYSTHASGFTSIECPDDFTVVFNCEYAKPDMLYQIIPILPEHIWSAQEDVFSYEPTELVGSGPFIYNAERSVNGNVAFLKNTEYWGQQANVDVLVFAPYDNYDSAAQALMLGEVDACYALDKTQYDTLSAQDGIYVDVFEGFGFEYLGYNLLDPMMADQIIRYAIDYCFDRESAVEMGYGGLAEAGYGLVNNEGFVYEPAAAALRAFSTDAANALLDEAGYLDTDGDGIREKEGTPLSFELITAAERSSWQSAVVNMMITNCAEAGIEITWNAIEKVTMWDTCYDGNPDWQMTLDGWGGDADPAFIMCIFQDWETMGYSGVAYSNPDFDAMYANAYGTVDEAERYDYIMQCQEILYADCPYTVICYDESVQAINSASWTGFVEGENGLFGNETVNTYVNVAPAA